MNSTIQNALGELPGNDLVDLLINELDGLIVTDNLGRYTFVSQRWSELTGLSLAEVKGRYVHDVMSDTLVDRVLRTGERLSGELIKIRNSRGEEQFILCAYTPLYREGELIGCFSTSTIHGMEEVMGISTKTDELLRQLNFYQQELAKIQGAKYSLSNIVGNSRPIQELKASITRAARSASTVLIQGETGTGKELVAHSIHALSPRAARPFIKINCAAIPAELMESELFGYEGGAFTGASRSGKKGKFQLADKGTLFLDEINQLPLQMQPKLLRALQEHEVDPVGGNASVPVDCRIIAAGNQPLDKLVREGLFREDLFYRLNVVTLKIPSLREHKEDIPAIAEDLLARLNIQLGMNVPGITEEAKMRLMGYDWPGNVRELQNVVERAMNLSWADTLTWHHFEHYFRHRPAAMSGVPRGERYTLREAKERSEREAVLQALQAANGNKTTAAEILGITRAMLYRKIEKLGLGHSQ